MSELWINGLFYRTTDVPGSRVSGVIRKDGRFQGKIFDSANEYFIERAEKFLTDSITPLNSPTDLLVGSFFTSYILYTHAQYIPIHAMLYYINKPACHRPVNEC